MDLNGGVRVSSRYNKLITEFYHPNFVATQFGMGQHIDLLHNSMAGASKILGMTS